MNSVSVNLQRLPAQVFLAHMTTIAVLLILHCIAEFVLPLFENRGLNKAGRAFSLTEENSVTNYFSALALMATSSVAALIALCHRSRGSGIWVSWGLAALAVAFMSFDEGAMLHDRLSSVVQETAQTSGVFYIGWVLPYTVLVVVALLAGWPLLRSLRPGTRRRLFWAATLFIGGALGLEMLEGLLLERALPAGMSLREALERGSVPPDTGMAINVLELMEELLEMIAVALALRALLMHLTEDLGFEILSISKAAGTKAPSAGL